MQTTMCVRVGAPNVYIYKLGIQYRRPFDLGQLLFANILARAAFVDIVK
jgi:hypothetical protein